MRYALALILVVAAFVPATAQAQVMPDRQDETQAWHDDGRWKANPTVGNESQEHNHLTCEVRPFQKITTNFALNCVLLGHNSNVYVDWIRWSCESDVKQVRQIDRRMTGAFEEAIVAPTLTINPSLCPGGWHEIRISDNLSHPGPIADGGGRIFHTTRLCIFLRASGSFNYCGGPTQQGRCGGGAWYERTNYLIAFIDCRDLNKTLQRALVAGDTLRFKSQGAPLWVHLNAKFHSGDVGTVKVAAAPGQTWKTVTIPAGLSPGIHKLHVRAQSNATGEAGAYVVPFLIGGSQAARVV